MFAEYLDKHNIKALFVPQGERLSIPPASRREAWEAIPPKARAEILSAAHAQQGAPYPALTATQFMAFVRTGDRVMFEGPYFARRKLLLTAMLAECIEHRGEYLDQIIDGLWCVCEESFWGISAHNGSSHPGVRPAAEHPLPDVENPYIDLFAAQTSALVLWICYLLREELDAVTPMIRQRVLGEAERRILRPFFYHDDFWWMGMIRRDVNNWTPWILSNVIATLLLVPMEDSRLAEGMMRALRMLDSYLAVMPPDGGCDEGAAYWNMAGGALLDCLEHLYTLTGGRVCFYDQPLIQNIGAFPLHAHIQGPWFWNFADCDARPALDGQRIWRYGLRTENRALSELGSRIFAAAGTVLPGDTPETFRVLCSLFDPPEPAIAEQPEDKTSVLPDLEVWAVRRGGFYAAMKGGHNGESHNHNDVGSFLLYLDGEPQVVDAGNMVYTAKTFGPERYTLWNTRSRNHNVPLIGPCEQAAGRSYAAKEVSMGPDGMSLDMAAAYPKEAGVLSHKREARLTPEGFTLNDSFALGEPRDITWVFLLRHEPRVESGLALAGKIALRFDPVLRAECEEIPVTDRRMARNFPGSLWRLTLTCPAVGRANQTFIIDRRTGV